MLIHLLRDVTGSDRLHLDAYLGRARSSRTIAEAGHILALMERHGSIEFAREFARGIADEAETSFERAFGPEAALTDQGQFVRALINYMLQRTS